MDEKEKLKVYVKLDKGKCVCICLRCHKGCNNDCNEDIVVRNRFAGWQSTMIRDRYGR